jgi:hypothetical protein
MQTPNTQPTSTNDAVATAAYYQWLKAGQPTGRDQEFWLKAEAELRKHSQAVPQKSPAIRAANGTKSSVQL